MNGFINIYKEKGFTSHDCVAMLRRIIGQKKIGHMGTLDPDACGVLPIALGKATRLIELFDDEQKTYRVRMLLGTVTDTLDMSGTVLEKQEVNTTEEEVEQTVRSFLGEQMQVPPMYSALKKDGKKLYELARAGVTVERSARKVTFYDIFDLNTDLPFAEFSVTCSRGTYIRSLCDDIGKKLGCGACMESLERLSVGPFTKETARTISEVRDRSDAGELDQVIISMTEMIPDLAKITCDSSADLLAHNGNPIEKHLLNGMDLKEQEKFWLIDSAGVPVGIYKIKKEMSYPVKMVYENALL